MAERSVDISRPTAARIDLDELAFNFRSARSFIGGEVAIMAVIKANAYGHGSVEIARRLSAEGVDWFGVALPEEGIELRDAGITERILCLGGFWPGQESAMLRAGITPVVFTPEHLALLDHAAKSFDRSIDIHVKIDTGMGRLGVRYDESDEFARLLAQFPTLRLEGMMTHFAAADDPEQNSFTDIQIGRFDDSVQTFRKYGLEPIMTDLANSPGAVAHPRSYSSMVRLGGLIYGLGDDVLPTGVEKPELHPVMSIQTEIAQIKNVPAGDSLGYGRTYIAQTDSQIAVIPIGYADGLPRALSNKGKVLVDGKFAPIVGRISMDWTIIDVTGIDDVKVGDRVTVIGRDGDLSIRAEDLASICDTISYEITCGFNERVPRHFITGKVRNDP